MMKQSTVQKIAHLQQRIQDASSIERIEALIELGNLWAESNVSLAENFYKDALNHENSSILQLAKTCLSLSRLYFGEEKYAKALTYCNKALEYLDKEEDIALLAESWEVRGRSLYALCDFEAAIQALLKSSKFYEVLQKPSIALKLRSFMGRCYLALGKEKQALEIASSLQVSAGIHRNSENWDSSLHPLFTLDTLENTPSSVLLVPRVQEIIATFEEYASSKEISIVLDTSPATNSGLVKEEMSVKVDTFLLRQVIGNVIDNAITSSPNGTQVLVRVNAAQLPALPGHIKLILSVQDERQGMPDDESGTLLKKHTGLSGAAAGEHVVGLGLSAIKNIVSVMKGSIEYKPAADGKGSLFIVSMPVPIGTHF